jgi:hypothetical protein
MKGVFVIIQVPSVGVGVVTEVAEVRVRWQVIRNSAQDKR